jgi:Tfp pilus assembly protein PilX
MKAGSNEWTRAMVLVLVLFVLCILALIGLATLFSYLGRDP